MESVDCNINTSESTLIPWSYQTNWIIARGSLQASLAVESSDHPIAEPDPESAAARSPLILKPSGSDSAPCEIKIYFKQKYEVCQIYVRSSARAYEIYYATSPRSVSEYLSTVRCCVAERDDGVLQISCVEDVAEEHGECLSRDVIAETASNGASTDTVTSEDDWVKIKVPGAGSSPASIKIGTNVLNNTQDLYEATAQISDLDPCLSLTIRLLSLQDKGYVHVDEIYVFVDPVQSTDSGNEAVLAGSSAQSSLMAMFMPTLLQLSKSGVSTAQDKHASDEVLKNGKMETTSTVIDRIDSPQQLVKPKELGMDTAASPELQQPTSAKTCVETKIANSSQSSHLETAMEQLISRLSRVEDICLRFEKKMLKPIERIEERLQQVEHQLEKLSKSSPDFGFPHCTRISAPEFSCSESNSSSFYNDELEKKDFTSDNVLDLSHEANFHPGLIISAPEFSYGEGDEGNDNLEPLKNNPPMKPKKSLSVDDALAAALHGFLSDAVNPSEPIQTPTGLLGDANEEIQNEGHAESCQVETRESPAAENDNRELSQYAQVLTVKAPEFTAEETGSVEQLDFDQSTFDIASVTENDKKEYGNEMVTSSIESKSLFSDGSCCFGRNESTKEIDSASDGDSSAVPVIISKTCLDGILDVSSSVNMIDTYFEGDTIGDPANFSLAKDTSGVPVIVSKTCLDRILDVRSSVNMIDTYFEGDTSDAPAKISLAKDFSGTSTHQVSLETNLGKLAAGKPENQAAASEENLGHKVETVSEDLCQVVAIRSIEDDAERVCEHSHVAFRDLEFPILEVRFASDRHMSTKSPLEALLYGDAEPNTEAPLMITKETDADRTSDEISDLLAANGLLLDHEVSAIDVSSHLEGAEMDESLI